MSKRPAKSPLPASFFCDVVGSLRNGVVVITSQGVLAHMNREAYRILGLSASSADVGARYVDVLRARPEVIRILRSAFELSNPPNRAELRLANTGRVIGYTVCPVRDASSDITGALLLFKDLTRVEHNEERERLRDRLAALGEMAAAFAHEVKNPLAGIKVLAGLLRRRLAGVPEAETLLNDIIGEANMADAIVVEILEFVRPIRLHVEPVVLADILVEARRTAETRVNPGAIEVAQQLSPDLPTLEADGTQIRQIFSNLLINAFEALDGVGRVTIAAHLKPTEVDPDSFECAYLPPAIVVTVSDNGPGVPDELRDRIFNAFFTTKPKGSGLGLAIVRKIVDAHDGRIDLEVGEQGGTTFIVTLPVCADRQHASPFVIPPSANPSLPSLPPPR